MLVTPESNRRNRRHALVVAGAGACSDVYRWLVFSICASLPRACARSSTGGSVGIASGGWRIMKQPFPATWEQILLSQVAFFRALKTRKKSDSVNSSWSFSMRSGLPASERR